MYFPKSQKLPYMQRLRLGQPVKTVKLVSWLGKEMISLSPPGSRARLLPLSPLTRIIHEPKKPTEEGALGSRMILKTAVSQEHHNPKPRASVVLVQYQSVSWSRSGAMRPDSPLGLTTSSWHMSPRRVQRSFT